MKLLVYETLRIDSLGLKGILRGPGVTSQRVQAQSPNEGNRADFKRFLGEGWAVNTSTGNSALLAGNSSLELASF